MVVFLKNILNLGKEHKNLIIFKQALRPESFIQAHSTKQEFFIIKIQMAMVVHQYNCHGQTVLGTLACPQRSMKEY